MSAIDPRTAAEQRRERLRGSRRALVAVLLSALLSLLAAAVLGVALGGVFEQLRVVSINSVFGSWDTGIPVEVRAWGLPVGILGSVVALGQYSRWNHAWTGRDDVHAVVGPLPLALAGLTVGTAVSTTMWTPPDAVGVAVDTTFSHDEPWGIGEWILYAGQWWLPALLALLTLLSLLARDRIGSSR